MSDTEILYRDATLEVREDHPDEWVVSGLAVPYKAVAKIGDYRESFEHGAFAEVDADLPIYYGHNHLRGEAPIGKITATEESEAGLNITARISKTVRGTETYQLLKDGVLRHFSVGFKPVAHKIVDDVVIRTKAALFEVSVVPQPAYAGASISEVRDSNTSAVSADEETNKEIDMTDSIVSEIRSEVEDLSRRFSVLESADKSSDAAELKFRSLGEFVKGLTTRSVTREDAEMLTRAYTGATTGDSVVNAGWINRDVKLVKSNRRIFEQFSKEPLPADGMSVAYPKFSGTTGDVAVQAAEGDDLTYLELQVTTGTADVKTYGGYSQLSRQAIERSSVGYLNKVLDRQKISYAKATNGAVRTALSGASSTNTQTLAFADKGKGIAWSNAVLTAVQDIENNSAGLSADLWIMGATHFAQIASIVDSSNRPVFVLNGDGSNTVGDVNVRGLAGSVAGLPIFLDPGMTGTASYIVSREALTTLESGPFNLADDNIINLSKDFSIYGYLAITVNDVKGISKVTHPTS